MNKWSNEDIKIILDNMGKVTWDELYNMSIDKSHTRNSMINKAKRLGYTNNVRWTHEEIDIINNYYSKLPMNIICEMLPNRDRTCIIMFAKKLGVKSFTNRKYTNEENQYIKDNWFLCSDVIMAKVLNRTFRSVKCQREKLGLYRQNKSEKNYTSLAQYLRRNTSNWKNKSIKNCNKKCIFTGDEQFDVHHVYPVNTIINECLHDLNIPCKVFSQYSEKELLEILTLFEKKQDMHLGACIRKDIHKLFHSMYGVYDVHIEQWEQFVVDLKNGIYKDFINLDVA